MKRVLLLLLSLAWLFFNPAEAQVWGRTTGKSERVTITTEKSTGLTLVLKQFE